MRRPSALPLDQYEAKLNDFIGNYCHRRLASGWKMDKTVRDAGPFVASLATEPGPAPNKQLTCLC
jgi:hypothetical protein